MKKYTLRVYDILERANNLAAKTQNTASQGVEGSWDWLRGRGLSGVVMANFDKAFRVHRYMHLVKTQSVYLRCYIPLYANITWK